MASSPTVLFPLSLPALLRYILTTQSSTARTTLIICSSRDTFLHDYAHSLKNQNGPNLENLDLDQLITPTLRNLFTARCINVAFCASVQALLAYLTAHRPAATKQDDIGETTRKERIVLANPLSLHAPTPSFSAQGLSRMFAAATEMALRLGAMLLVVECQGLPRKTQHLDDDEEEVAMNGERSPTEVNEEDPWEEEVSILNVSARRFGSSSGERVWAGRTVKAKRIAARWFRFHKIDGVDEGEGHG